MRLLFFFFKMNPSSNISSHDQHLAELIGQMGWKNAVSSQSDELLLLLDEVQELDLNQSTFNVDAAWMDLEQKLESPSPKAAIYTLYTWKAIAVAALVLLSFGFLSWTFFFSASQPSLVALSTDTIHQVTLPDGSTVMLRPHSSLFIKGEATSRMEYILDGEAYFDIVKNPNRTFIVESGLGRVEVLGTAFTLRNWGNQSEVFVSEGRVAFSQQKTGEGVHLEANQAGRIHYQAKTPQKITDVPAQLYVGWLTQELHFEQRTVASLKDELEHHFKVKLQISTQIQRERLSGSLSLATLHQSLTELELVLGGRFEWNEPQHTWVFRNF